MHIEFANSQRNTPTSEPKERGIKHIKRNLRRKLTEEGCEKLQKMKKWCI